MHVKSAQTLHINMVGYLGPLTIAIAGGRSRRSSGSNARNVLAYAISQGIAHRLERGTGKDADAARIPLAQGSRYGEQVWRRGTDLVSGSRTANAVMRESSGYVSQCRG
jgi:hypothetical protein